MEPGFYKISGDEYHKGPGISSSNLKDILQSAAHYRERKENPPGPTPAFIIGDAFHALTLELKRFEKEYFPLPEDHDGRKAEGKARIAEIESSGQTPLKYSDYQNIKAMAAVVHNHESCIELLSDGEPELSGYWIDPQDPRILCKLRMDWIRKTDHIIVDLKSCTDARPQKIISQAYNLKYHIQAAFYCYGCTHITGIEHSDFRFIFVEKDPPYGVQVYRATPEFLQEGLIKVQEALDMYSSCLDSGEWPCYDDIMEDLILPGWVRRNKDLGIWEG